MSSVSLNPKSTNYLTSFIESNHMTSKDAGLVDLPLAPNTALDSDDNPPQATSTGNLVVYLKGAVKIVTASPDMALVTFPASVLPADEVHVTCVKETGAGAKTAVVLILAAVGVITTDVPATDDIYYLDSVFYLRSL